MGTVYEARQRSLDRIVALKVLPEHFSSSPKAVQRFQREAQAAGKLHHTHIIPIFARGEDNDTYFYAMELVRGESLNALITDIRQQELGDADTANLAETVPIDRSSDKPVGMKTTVGESGALRLSGTTSGTQPLPPNHIQEVATHVANVADALDYAHSKGVIHRDIKPHNLMLGEDGRIRVADFGLARLAEQPGVTLTGEVVGSPLYMAPELLTGGPAAADHRADIYSLGATMYEWLTLAPPHPGDTRETVISSILTTEPKALREHNPVIPIDMETICLKCMDRDPARRYRSAADLRDDLRRFLEQRTIRAKRAGFLERARKFVVRNQVASVTGVAAVVVALLLYSLVQSKKDDQANADVVASLQQKVAQIEEAAEQLKQENETIRQENMNIREAARLAAPFGGAELDMIDGASRFLAQNVGIITSPDPVSTDNVTTRRGIALRMAKDLYDELAPPDFFEKSSNGTETDVAYQLGTAHDPAYREFPATAIVMVNFYIQQNGFDFDAVHLRTLLHSQLEQFNEMKLDAERLIQIRPSDPTGYVWRGLGKLLTNNMKGTLEDIEEATKLGATGNDQLAKWCHTIRGMAFIALGRPTDAIAFLDTALARDAAFFTGSLARAFAADVVGDLPVAIAFLSRAIAMEPNNVDCIVARGKRLADMGNVQAARRDYNTAIRMVGASATIAVLMTETMTGGIERSAPTRSRDLSQTDSPQNRRPPAGLNPAGESAPRQSAPAENGAFKGGRVAPNFPPGQTSTSTMRLAPYRLRFLLQ